MCGSGHDSDDAPSIIQHWSAAIPWTSWSRNPEARDPAGAGVIVPYRAGNAGGGGSPKNIGEGEPND
jgi:hypothetical protein